MSFNLRWFDGATPPNARLNRAAADEFESDEAVLEYFVRRSIQNGKGRRLIAPQLAASDPFQPDHPVLELLARRTCRRLAAESGFGATLRRCARWLRGRRTEGGALPRSGAPNDTVVLANDSPTVICREEDGKEP